MKNIDVAMSLQKKVDADDVVSPRPDTNDVDYFSSQLAENVKRELGEISTNWFEDAIFQSTSTMRCCKSEKPVQECLNANSVKSDRPSSPIFDSPNLHPLGFSCSPEIQGCGRSPNDWAHSTPVNVTVSLGASMGGHDLSWTSSMATPVVPSAEANNPIKEKHMLDKKEFVDVRSSNDLCETAAQDSDVKESLVANPKSEIGLLSVSLKGPSSTCATVVAAASVAQEFKKPAEKVKLAETSQSGSIVSLAVTSPPKNYTEDDEGSCHILDCSATPKKPKSALPRVSLPRRRMADLCPDVASESTHKCNEDYIQKDNVSIIEMETKLEANSAVQSNKPELKHKEDNQGVDSVCGNKESSASDGSILGIHRQQLECAIVEPSTFILDSVINDSKPFDVVVVEDIVGVNPEQFESDTNLETSQNGVIPIPDVDHDYAKPSVLNPRSDDTFSQQLNNDSQLMEIVDCTTACLESIRDDPFSCELCPDMAFKSEFMEPSNKEDIFDSAAIGCKMSSPVSSTKSEDKCSKPNSHDDVITVPEVKDDGIWDPDFVDVEMISPVKSNTNNGESLRHHLDTLILDTCKEYLSELAEEAASISEDSLLMRKNIELTVINIDPVDEPLAQKYKSAFVADSAVKGSLKEVFETECCHLIEKTDQETSCSSSNLPVVTVNDLAISEDNNLKDTNKSIEKEEDEELLIPMNVCFAKQTSASQLLHSFFPAVGQPVPGFSMASGKAVQVSRKSMEDAQRRLQDDLSLLHADEPEEQVFEDNGFDNESNKEKTQAFQGFSTASGKLVTVSDCALKKARQLCSEIVDVESVTLLDKPELDSGIKPFQGFFTAGGKVCKVSEDALRKGRHVYEKLLSDVTTAKTSTCGMPSSSAGGGDGRGMKRLFTSTVEQVCEPPNKVNLRSDDDDKQQEEQLAMTNTDVTGAMDVSEDSLDAAQALIAMSNASWNEPNVDTYKEIDETIRSERGIPKTETPIVEVTESSCLVESEAKCDLDVTSHDMSVEVLESTFAFLEDERHSDVSKSGGSFRPFESPSVTTSKALHDEESKRYTPGLLRSHLAKCKRILCEDTITSTAKECVPENLKDAEIQSLVANVTSGVPNRRITVIHEQLERISEKSKMNTSPSMGMLYHAKTNNKHARLTLRQFFSGTPRSLPCAEALKLGVKESTLNVRSRNAEEFRFSFNGYFRGFSSDNDDGVMKLEQGACLVLGENNSAGKEEFYKALMDCTGVDPKLVNREWVANHYRWIVWKLAAVETSFPRKCAGRCLTPERVFSELRYRVNCEIDCSRRSALKKITERDDIPMKTMILCVADIIRSDPDASLQSDQDATKNSIHLELTDGWYSMMAIMDKPLAYLVERGEISVGQKLVVHGVEIVGSSEACSPLEVQSNQFLKLSYNCCRRARWDAKLGYLLCSRPFPLPLNSFRSDGGLIGRVDVVIARVYPLQYLEKRSDGSSLVCSAKTNALANQQADIQKCALMDRLYEDARSKLEKDDMLHARKRRFSSGARNLNAEEMKALVSGEELSEALQNAADPILFESCLTSTQKESLVSYSLVAKETKQAQLQVHLSKFMQAKQDDGEFPMERNVVSFLKVRVASVHRKDVHQRTTSLMTVWRPSENIEGLLEEGKCIRIYYLMAERRSNGRELLVKSTKMTKFEAMSKVSDDVIKTVYKPREFTPFDVILSPGFQPLYGEVDVVGVVLSTGNTGQPQRGKFEVVYLANANQDVVGIKFWGGLKAFGVEAVLEPASVVVGCNLQWRGRERTPIPCVYMLEISTFTRNPKGDCAKRLTSDLRRSIKDLNVFLEKAKEKIADVVQCNSSALLVSPLCRPGQPPKFVSTPKSNFRPPFKGDGATASIKEEPLCTISALNTGDVSHAQSSDLALRKMRQLQRYVGAPPQLGALASSCPSSVSPKYKVPLSKPGPSLSK